MNEEDKHRVEEWFLHFDDELGMMSVVGATLVGAGLVAIAAEPVFSPLSVETITTLVGLVLIVLDYHDMI